MTTTNHINFIVNNRECSTSDVILHAVHHLTFVVPFLLRPEVVIAKNISRQLVFVHDLLVVIGQERMTTAFGCGVKMGLTEETIASIWLILIVEFEPSPSPILDICK